MKTVTRPAISEMKPKITIIGVGGGGGNAVNNMIAENLQGAEFVVANTDAQALAMSKASRLIQLGAHVTEGLGAGSLPDIGRAAAEELIGEIMDHLAGTHMCFLTAGMGGGTGTGAAPIIAQAARDAGILTVAVVTKPFVFEGKRRMQAADAGIDQLRDSADTVIVIPNQNLFRIADAKTTFAGAFAMADRVLYSGVGCITDLIVKEGLINLDFADVRSVMRDMGRAMMGTGEAAGEGRAQKAAEAAIANPLLDEASMIGAKGVLVSISGGMDMTLFEVDEAATRIREEVGDNTDIIVGAIFDDALEGKFRVSVVATGLRQGLEVQPLEVHIAGRLDLRWSHSGSGFMTIPRRIAAASKALNAILGELRPSRASSTRCATCMNSGSSSDKPIRISASDASWRVVTVRASPILKAMVRGAIWNIAANTFRER